MKKTYITRMPDESGAFLEASRIIANHGANITRVSYNKAIDMHVLFIDVEGSEDELDNITAKLEALGYIHNADDKARVMLLEFRLNDVPGAVLPILELIHEYKFNISYLSSQENGSPYQNFKMGLFVDDPQSIKEFLDKAMTLCEVRVIEYNQSDKSLDNTVFYMGFADEMAEKLNLDKESRSSLVLQSNLLMQMLDEHNESPHKTFEYLGKYAETLARYKGAGFIPRVSETTLSGGRRLYAIEPPCGSNVFIVAKDNSLLFIDSGFACYADEMRALFERLFPSFDSMNKEIVITHPDMDHCGLLPQFNRIYASELARTHFERELRGEPNFREEDPRHAPYCRISRLFSSYLPPRLDSLVPLVDKEVPGQEEPLCYLGSLHTIGGDFEVYRGNGGHAVGEIVLIDTVDKIVFSGDIIVNTKGFSKSQADFNKLAPFLMISVNMDSAKAKEEREYLMERFSPQEYSYFCGHGAPMMRAQN